MSNDAIINAFLRRYTADREAGATRTAGEYEALWPEHASLIRAMCTNFELGHDSPTLIGADVPQGQRTQLGPYTLLHEVRRGGQGVLYLAEDSRLRRRVALKVLTEHGTLSLEALARFQREAEAAARLHHPGICAVYEAGHDRGIPYLAMPFLEGQTLADCLARSSSSPTKEDQEATGRDHMWCEETSVTPADSGLVPLPPRDRNDVLAVVALFEQAARALHVAHEAGIVHRDIKPGNVMVSPRGEPVILDFGLAYLEGSEGPTVTRTGDVFGTPAYMSPEQLAAQRIRIDRRTDIWSLGVTLFECLTYQRPFTGVTRQALYQAILTKEAPEVRRLNHDLPKDLEVVVGKTLEKDRDRRYETALALAEDLEAVRTARPITARPVGVAGRLGRWARREPAKAALAATLLLALPSIGALLTRWITDLPRLEAQGWTELQAAKDEELSNGLSELVEGNITGALTCFERACAMEGGCIEAIAGIVVVHLRNDRPQDALKIFEKNESGWAERPAGILLRADALRRIGRSEEARELEQRKVTCDSAIDHYLVGLRHQGFGRAGNLAASHEALLAFTRACLTSTSQRELFLQARAGAAGLARDREAAETTARILCDRWPGSPQAWTMAGIALSDCGLDDEALECLRQAIKLRQGHAIAHSNLGITLRRKGRLEDAVASFREAIRLNPDRAGDYSNLGNALSELGRQDEALTNYREAVRRNPLLAEAHTNLGSCLREKGLLDEAIASHREAVRLMPLSADAHTSLGNALRGKGLLDDAIASLREAVRLDPSHPLVHYNLGVALTAKGLVDEAITCQLEAVRQKPDNFRAHYSLGNAFMSKGRLVEAVASFREAVRLSPGAARAWCNLGLSLRRQGQYQTALDALRRGHELGSKEPGWTFPSGRWIRQCEEYLRRQTDSGPQSTVPESADEAAEPVAAAHRALETKRTRLAVQKFQEAFSKNAALAHDLGRAHRYQAAVAAAQAGSGLGEDVQDLGDAEQADLRRQALDWLIADLAAWRERIDSKSVTMSRASRALLQWLEDTAFTGVREEESLGRLDPTERESWVKLWAEVRTMVEGLNL